MIKQKPLERFMHALMNSLFGVIIFVISVLAFNMPYEFAIVPRMATLLPIVRTGCWVVLAICFILLYAGRLRLFRDNWFMLALILFLAVLIYSTRLNGGAADNMALAYADGGLFALANALIFAIYVRINPRRYLLIFYVIFFIINIINTYTVFRYAGVGMPEVWGYGSNPVFSLVGNFNLGIIYVVPMMLAGCIWASKYGRWLTIANYAGIIMSIAMAFRCDSETQLIAYVLIVVVMIINDIMHAAPGIFKVLRFFNAAVFLAFDTVLFLLVVVFNKVDFIARIGYDGDFHGRYNIWRISKGFIIDHPVFGNGVETLNNTADKWSAYGTDAGHSHCFFLEVPYQSGLVGTLFFIAMLVLVIIMIFRAKNIHTKWLLSTFIGITFLAALVESYPMIFMVMIPTMCYYIAAKDREEAAEDEWQRAREDARYRRTAERKKTRYKENIY